MATVNEPDRAVQELLERARSGAPDAATGLVSLCGARLFRYGKSAAPHLSDADLEDLCGSAVERAVLRLDRYEPHRASFHAWLRGFLRREIYEHGRRTSAGHSSAAPAQEQADRPPWPEDAWDEEVPEPDLHRQVRQAVSRLRETDQLMLSLRVHEALPFASIAAQLGVEETSCRQRYRRAVARLRAELATETSEDGR